MRVGRGKQHVSYPCPNVLKRVVPPRPWGVLVVANAGDCTGGIIALTLPGGYAYRPKIVG